MIISTVSQAVNNDFDASEAFSNLHIFWLVKASGKDFTVRAPKFLWDDKHHKTG